MGGGKKVIEEEICQICEEEGYTAMECQWVYSKCKVPGCIGLMKIMKLKDNEVCGKKYLKCQFDKCSGFEWFEHADPTGQSTSSSQTNNQGNSSCFLCGQKDHWMSNCPWKETYCPSNCQGTRKLWTSRQKKSCGQKFLKCLSCGHFQWLSEAIEKSKNVNIRVKLEVSLNDLCDDFEKKKFMYEG